MIRRNNIIKAILPAITGILFCMVFVASASAQVSISSFIALPDTIDPGGTSTLAWATVNATSCAVNGSAVNVNASMAVSPATNTTYTLTCQGTGGPVSRSVTVKVRFIVQGKVKTPTGGGNALANDVAVKYIRVIVMSQEIAGADRELARGYTNSSGDFSISFTDNAPPLAIYINVEYVGDAVDGKVIEVRRVNTDASPIKDENLSANVNTTPGRINLGTVRLSTTRANIVSQIGDAVRFLKNIYPGWVMPQNINAEGRTTNGASFVTGDGSYISISLEDYNNPGAGSAAFSDMHHETFHWVAYRAYGNRWPSPACNPGPHDSTTESCEGFAMAEGSAQYFGSSSAVPDQKTVRPSATDWRGADGTGNNNSGEIVEGALERAWYLSADLSNIVKVILSRATDTMEDFRDWYAVEVGPTSAGMQYFLSRCAENGIVYTRGRIDSIVPETASTGNYKIINNVAFLRGKIKPQISLMTRLELKLGPNSSRVPATHKSLGYKTAVIGLAGGVPTGFIFTAPVAFADDLIWDTATVANGEYDLLVRTKSNHDWEDTFNPDFTGDATASVNTTEKWLKTQRTWYNHDNTPTTDDEGKVVVDNSIPDVSIGIRKTR